MTAPSKIHIIDPNDPEGRAVCGRPPKLVGDRRTDDPAAVTCRICRDRLAETGTILDRIPTPRGRTLPDLTRRPRAAGPDPARENALNELVARHLDEFLELYRVELTENGS